MSELNTINAWHLEKIDLMMSALVSIADEVRKAEPGSPVVTAIAMPLATALKNATKLYLSLNGRQSTGLEYETILEKGRDGFNEVLLRAGLRSGLTIAESICEIEACLREGPGARTRIYDALSATVPASAPFVVQAKEVLERRTMGEMKWDEFLAKMRDLISMC